MSERAKAHGGKAKNHGRLANGCVVVRFECAGGKANTCQRMWAELVVRAVFGYTPPLLATTTTSTATASAWNSIKCRK